MTDGTTSNRLAHATSPYLLQHATNPVDWYPWGEEALRRAKDLDRPIFLSVGYSSCHWCHVMERESFESSSTAAIMNAEFVNIKVDREERPDIDSIYMNAVQMLTGSGGWPMSLFLTPDLRPFWGGTYFPPRAQGGRPGFPDILRHVARAYREQRDTIEAAGAEITERLRRAEIHPVADKLPDDDALDAALAAFDRTFDAEFGGFGPAPKFPRSFDLSFLLRCAVTRDDETILSQVVTTLNAMASGGMYDQIGGGFHRYATDRRWLVPHFEKMLYDNALLARIYIEAWQATKRPLFRRVAEETLDYALREMRDRSGGFFSATDADSEGEEGRFFVWRPEDVIDVLGREEGRVVCEYFNITERGNFEHRTSIPHVARGPDAVASLLGMETDDVEACVERGRKKLYEARLSRPAPFRDEKLITAWNGLMISAMARGYQVFEESRYRTAAESAVDRIRSELWRSSRLLRTLKDGQARHAACLDDYAYLAEALVDLYEATFDLRHLKFALEICDAVLDGFWDDAAGGFYYTAHDHEELICRQKQYLDNATPSASAVMTLTLLRAERLTGRATYRDRAEAALRSAADFVQRAPIAMAYTLLSVDMLQRPALEVAIVGDAEESRPLLRAIHSRFLPRRVLAACEEPSSDLAEVVPLLAGKKAIQGQATAYVCRDFACRAPVTGVAELARELDASS